MQSIRRNARGAIACLAWYAAACDTTEPHAHVRVAVVATIAHPTADACVDGFLDAWREGADTHANIEKRFGNGDTASLRHAMDVACRARPDLLLALGSAAIREACMQPGAQPIVGAWCFDLLAACGDASQERLWGIETPPPTREQVRLLASLEPRPARVGVVYAPEEAIAQRQVASARAMFEESGIELVERHVAGPSEVDGALDELAGRGIDALWKLSDTTVARASKQLFARCAAMRMPVVGDAESQLADGAVAVAFVDFRRAGEHAARIARRALAAAPGEKPERERLDAPIVRRNEARLRELSLRLR